LILFTPQNLFFSPLPPDECPHTVPNLHPCSIIIIVIVILSLSPTSVWEHGIFVLLSLAYLIRHDDLQFCSLSCKWHSVIIFLWMSKIPWWVLCMCVCMHTIFSFLADSTVWLLWRELQQTWMCRCLSCILSYTPSDICPRLIRQGHKVDLFLVFWGTSILISLVVVLLYTFSNSIWGFGIILIPKSNKDTSQKREL
jgi:hypothetical protein